MKSEKPQSINIILDKIAYDFEQDKTYAYFYFTDDDIDELNENNKNVFMDDSWDDLWDEEWY